MNLETAKALFKAGKAIDEIKMLLIDGEEITDAEGNSVEIAELDVSTKAPEGDEEEAPAEDMTEEALERAVDKALAKQAKAKATQPSIGKPISKIPASVKRYGRIKNFTGTTDEKELKAYTLAQVILASLGNNVAVKWLRGQGHQIKVANESNNLTGGALVPEEVSSDIIRLVETFGVFRNAANVVPMVRETLDIPRVLSEGSANWVGESVALTETDDNYEIVMLVAKKLSRIQRVSNELMEDALLSMADRFALSVAQKFAVAEDSAGFNGAGAVADGGIQGITVKIGSAGVKTAASGNDAFGNLDMVDFHAVTGALPEFVGINPSWYISRVGFSESMERLAHAQGGVTRVETEQGSQLQFLGAPVVICQTLNTVSGTDASAIKLLYGDLSMSSSMGIRSDITIAASSDRYFEQDQTALRAIERVAINNHDVGDSSNAGPVIALKTAS